MLKPRSSRITRLEAQFKEQKGNTVSKAESPPPYHGLTLSRGFLFFPHLGSVSEPQLIEKCLGRGAVEQQAVDGKKALCSSSL